jgi:uncharacterized protein YbaA (DUF1428 family)
MGCRDMRCIMHRSGDNNMQYQTTAFVAAIVDDHPVGDLGMPKNTIYDTSKEIIVWKTFQCHVSPHNSSKIYVFHKMPPEPTWKPHEKPKPYQRKPKVPVLLNLMKMMTMKIMISIFLVERL